MLARMIEQHRAGDDCFRKIMDYEASDGEVEVLTRELDRAYVDGEWDLLQALVILASKKPKAIYRQPLCRILGGLSPKMTNEDIVDVLWDIAAEDCIPALEKAACAQLPNDEYRNLNKKALQLIKKIDSPNSWAALRRVSESGPADVRGIAADIRDS